MTIKITRKASHWLAALLSMAALFSAIAQAADDAPPVVDPPAGQLLIASAEMQDPRFQRTVILLLKHDSSGAFGIVINRPLGKRPLAAFLSETDSKDSQKGTVEGSIPVFLGGPVQPQLGFVVHSGEYRHPETLVVGEELAMTANREVLRDIGRARGSSKTRSRATAGSPRPPRRTSSSTPSATRYGKRPSPAAPASCDGFPYSAFSIASALEASTWPGCASMLSAFTTPFSTSIE